MADILSQPQPNFEFFKRMFRHGLLGVTKQGHPVWFMKVGDMKEGFKSYKTSGLTQRDLARHVALCMVSLPGHEACFTKISQGCPRP